MTAQHRRHARTRQTRTAGRGLPRALLRAGLAVSAAGAAVISGAAAASAAPALPVSGSAVGLSATGPQPDPEKALEGGASALDATGIATAGALRPAKDQPLHPLGGTPVDPLSNTVGAQVADFKGVSTEPVTAPLSNGGTLRTLPAVGTVTGLLPG
ncbi:hypothetical protein GCM10010420_21450 [Streptomyces glaucosporus]|uniref:ATP-binding protein n=1 Tax=Streptomyces glaucosporus TaxID=284044 RepID=A0ABP5V726_9ACTN